MFGFIPEMDMASFFFFKVAYKHSLKEMLRSQVQHLTHEHRTSEPLRLRTKDHKIQSCSPIEGLQSEKSFIFVGNLNLNVTRSWIFIRGEFIN